MILLVLVLLLGTGGPGVPGVPREDWEETLGALAGAGAAVSQRDLAELAGPVAAPDNSVGWERQWRPGRDLRDLVRLDMLTGPADVRLRLKSDSESEREIAGAVGLATDAAVLTAGWWSWRAGFGLLTGAAGRQPGYTADGSLLPARSGPRAWTGSADKRARRGGAIDLRLGPWRLGGATGQPADGDGPTTVVAAAGRADGKYVCTVVAEDGELAGLSGAGRWDAEVWRGAWEVVLHPAGGASCPTALAAALDWRPGRQVSIGGACVMSSAAGAGSLAAAHELTGRRGGDGWAVRGTWRVAPRVRFLALVSGRRRLSDDPGHQRRRLLELQVRCRPLDELEARIRYRGAVTEGPVWDPDWPWEAPRAGPVQRRHTLGLVVVRTVGEASFRADLRTLSLSGDGSAGRRSLLGLEARRQTPAGLILRAGCHEAWGDPVDLVSAISPLPGRLVPRHWGSWRSEIWGGVARDGRRGGVAFAWHLRRPRAAGRGVVEMRARMRLLW